MAIRLLNQNAEELNKSAAVNMNVNAAKRLQDVLKTNLGPKDTIKMLVGGAGDIKLTKDGNTLLKEMVDTVGEGDEDGVAEGGRDAGEWKGAEEDMQMK